MAKEDPDKVKLSYSHERGILKRSLYKKAYRRIQRAQKIGAHIEAVALIETVMSDRLESAISTITRKRISVNTLGTLVNELNRHYEIPEDLRLEIFAWGTRRAFVVHQMVKLTNNKELTWEERMKFARETSKDGLLLMNKLRKLTDKVIRDYGSKRDE